MIATEGTVKGGAYVRAIHAMSQAPVVQQACPLFVPMAEEGLTDGPDRRGGGASLSRSLAGDACRGRARWCWAAPIFRCSKRSSRAWPGADIALVDSAATTAEAVAQLLAERGLARARKKRRSRIAFSPRDASGPFRAGVGEIFLGTRDRSG